MATIKEVAALAGVSVGTVSNVINGYEHVKGAKRNQVLAAIDALGYKPNSIARTLKTKMSKTVGLIVPDISNPFYAEIARGTEDALRQFGYNLFLCSKDRNSDREADYADALMDKNVDGIIIIKPTINEKKIRSIGKTSKVILIDTYLPVNGNYAIINIDDEQSAYKMTEYLYRMGHRTIIYFSGNTDARSDKLRFRGYKGFMKKVNLYKSDHIIKCGIYRTSESYLRAFELFKNRRIPDAIFAANDILALGVIQAAFDSGLTIPGDISVVGCDDIEISSYFRPTLTTICRPKYNLGSAAASILIDSLVYGKPIQSLSLTLTAELVIRDSVIKKRGGRLIHKAP
jgi:LacI family transcriptional regulator